MSHVKSSGRDHEMVNQRGLWVESAIVAGRTHLTANNADLFRFKAELSKYFLWVRDLNVYVSDLFDCDCRYTNTFNASFFLTDLTEITLSVEKRETRWRV